MKSTEPFSLPCPQCEKEIKKTVGWFDKKECVCPFCSNLFNAKEFVKTFKAADKELSKTIKDININLKF